MSTKLTPMQLAAKAAYAPETLGDSEREQRAKLVAEGWRSDNRFLRAGLAAVRRFRP